MQYERDNIHRLEPYVPGEQPETGDVIKLNTNENPYPPAPAVLEAVRDLTGDALRRYPPPRAGRFRKLAAKLHNLAPEQVIATNGGDELLRLAITVFASPNRGVGGVGSTEPTYSLYPVLASIHDSNYYAVPLNDDFTLPGDFAPRLAEADCNLAFLVNPHAPSGRLFPLEQLRAIAGEFPGVLVIDEAYVNFAHTDALDLLRPPNAMKNVLILRTLSKGYSLAGIRFGYGLGDASLIAALDKARDSYNTSILSQTAAVAALENVEYAAANWQKVITERSRLTDALQQLGCFVYPSHTNFLLVIPPTTTSARTLYESLKKFSIFVRYFDQDRLRDKLRITIGTESQNNALIQALAELL